LVVDCLELWWEGNKDRFIGIQRLMINLDNGPHVQRHRTWFIKRLTEFSDRTALEIHLIYYPPYHSKYNPVERLWGILENHWNGALLGSVETALAWASTMTWNGIRPVVDLVTRVYEHGKRLTEKQMEVYEQRIKRSSTIPKGDVMICPQIG
jgi:transposase